MADKTYGIKDAAAYLEVEPATARNKFRLAGIKPTGRLYEWSSKEKMQADCDRANKAEKKPAKAAPKKAAKKKAPAKKAVKKQAPESQPETAAPAE